MEHLREEVEHMRGEIQTVKVQVTQTEKDNMECIKLCLEALKECNQKIRGVAKELKRRFPSAHVYESDEEEQNESKNVEDSNENKNLDDKEKREIQKNKQGIPFNRHNCDLIGYRPKRHWMSIIEGCQREKGRRLPMDDDDPILLCKRYKDNDISCKCPRCEEDKICSFMRAFNSTQLLHRELPIYAQRREAPPPPPGPPPAPLEPPLYPERRAEPTDISPDPSSTTATPRRPRPEDGIDNMVDPMWVDYQYLQSRPALSESTTVFAELQREIADETENETTSDVENENETTSEASFKMVENVSFPPGLS